MLRVTAMAVMLTVAGCTAAFGQQFRIIPREKLDSLANPVAAADSPLRFAQTKIDAGTIGEDDAPSEYRFTWHNDGREPLVITEVRTGCGCAVAKYDRKPVMPDGEGTITVTYHPKGHPGYFLRKIVVYTQGGNQPSAVLELSGNVTPSARPTHEYPHAMGALRLKQTEVRMDAAQRTVERIAVMNAGDTPLRITADSRLLPECLTVRCLPETIPAGGFADIEIAFEPQKVNGMMPRQIPVIIEGVQLAPSKRTIYVRFDNDIER